jgi:pyruvate dehydrogenase E2 component (dihydrolipoamide acetyltransferase)
MAYEIIMPRVDMDMATGRMGQWRAAEGAHVIKGATLFEIETDKAAMEVEAPASGVLRYVAAVAGDVLPVGACIGWIVAEGEDFAPPVAPAAVPPWSPRAAPRATANPAAAAPAGAARGPRATPAARTVARERGLRLDEIRGSGPGGRIQRRDVECVEGNVACNRRTQPPDSADSVERLREVIKRASRHRPERPSHVNREWLQRGLGAPIVFLHGFGADLNGWRLVQRLLPETRPALAIDLPGHGLTPIGDEATFEALVEAARAALIEEGAGECHLVGHSLGAAVAVALSEAPGVRALSLMLIAPAGLGEEANAAFLEGFLGSNTEAALEPWLRLLVTDPAALGSSLAKTTLRQRAERHNVAAQRRLAEVLFAGGRQAFSVRGRLAAPEMPVKIVVGLEDHVTPAHHADNLSGLIALHRLARVGHMPHFEARREVARLIEELARAARPE